MQQEVRIVTFINDREGREEGERTLTQCVNNGWEIKTAGGGTGAEMVWGFVILQRDRQPADQSHKTLTPSNEYDGQDED